ncbi:MAG TPA: dipeptidase PepE [Edaphocola sp.]|nr:dipeptidase PepE [Edaphocola sp.]
MKNIILASTSSLFGQEYLAYIRSELVNLFEGRDEIIFIPYARPGGISHEDYTAKAAAFFSSINKKITGLEASGDPVAALQGGQAFFVGGGNTFLLVKTLWEKKLMNILKAEVEKGKPYLGTSAGSNIGGLSLQTTNDMPIVYPPSFQTMGLVPFNINPHYLDPDPDSKHNGETRETRILEFLSQQNTPVVGLREGSWIRVIDDSITTEGAFSSRIFEAGKTPYELAPGSVLAF